MNNKSAPLITAILLLDVAFAAACEDVHPPVVSTPVERLSVTNDDGDGLLDLAFDPRGLGGIDLAGDGDGVWMRPARNEIWHYREWQWWKGHPWGDSCRPRYWTKAHFHVKRGDQPTATIEYRIDGFDTYQQFLMPRDADANAPHWDLVVTVQNVSGHDVEEYGQFFACYTPLNRGRSFWFWDGSGELVRFADRGVQHLDGYVVHPAAYFLSEGAIPHCPRGGGKIVGTWHRPVIVSHASPAGWRSVILLEPQYAASLAHGIEGGAMDYIVFPGPDQTTFANGAQFSAHIRHHMVRSPKLPSTELLDALWSRFERSHEAIHGRAAAGR